MSTAPVAPPAHRTVPAATGALFGWQRLCSGAIVCALLVLLFNVGREASMGRLVARVYGVGPLLPQARRALSLTLHQAPEPAPASASTRAPVLAPA